MTVIKRDRKESSADLVVAIEKLIPMLEDQDEDDAVKDLREAGNQLRSAAPGSGDHKAAVSRIIDAFEGDHELIAYTYQRPNSTDWSEAEELSIASSRVLNLARRMLQ